MPRPKTHQQKRREEKKLEDDIRRIYRRLMGTKDPEITSLVEAIIDPITSSPKKKVSKAAEIDYRAQQLTSAKLSTEDELALRLAEQELATQRARRAENMRRITLILELVV